MARALLTISFMAVFIWWLQAEFHKNVAIKKHWQWFAGALLVQALASVASLLFTDRVIGNLIYHAVGGGVTTTLLFVYLLKTYKLQYNWRVELVLLYAFVSSLGVLNELAEYAGEYATKVGLFSWDSHDTWRDLAANTTGSVAAWLLYRLCVSYAKSNKSLS